MYYPETFENFGEKGRSCNKRKIVEQILQIFHQDFESRPTSPYQACLKKEKKKETIVK